MDVDELRRLAQAATPGPWKQHLVDDTCVTDDRRDICTTFPEGGYDDDVDFNTDIEGRERDAAFIAAANPAAIIAILDEKDALTARVAELEAALIKICDTADANGRPNGKWHGVAISIARKSRAAAAREGK